LVTKRIKKRPQQTLAFNLSDQGYRGAGRAYHLYLSDEKLMPASDVLGN
jgi:hypothetical protein